ncbi:MAG: GHKL domain-containing protein [Oscillospiraceae bacterium]|nr:GHKL domain-containing protein [Oscillospiraceae bacterium]
MERFIENFFAVSAFAETAAAVYFFGKILKSIFRVNLFRDKKFSAEMCKKIFSALLLTFSVMQLSFGIFNSLTCLISPLLIGRNPIAASLTMILFNIFSLGMACLFYKIILRQTAFSADKNNAENSGLTALTLYLFAAGLYINISVFGNTVDSEKVPEIFRKSFSMLAVYAFGTAAVFAAVRTRKKLSEISFGAEIALKQAEQAGERLRKTAVFRHDAKKHIAVLSGLLKKGENACAEKYLSEIGGMVEGLSKPFNTGCAAADTILENAFCSCKKFGIKAEFDLRFQKNIMCTAELCGVLSNILDNAVNACRGLENSVEKFIRLRGGTQGDILFIETENRYDGMTFQKGTGLISIENTAKKHGGKVSIKCGDGVFSITVIMNMSDSRTNITNASN